LRATFDQVLVPCAKQGEANKNEKAKKRRFIKRSRTSEEFPSFGDKFEWEWLKYSLPFVHHKGKSNL
jgi:hypothetical protein